MPVRLIRSGRGKGRYVIDWRDEYGVRHSYAHGYSKRAADNFWHKQITLRAERRTLDRKPISGITFYTLCDEYLEKPGVDSSILSLATICSLNPVQTLSRVFCCFKPIKM